MTHHIHTLVAAAALALVTTAASAECTAVYKAKQDNPLRLDHSSMTISGPCTLAAATPKLQAALAARGWILLKVLSVSAN